jgi:hypothetical protein
VNIVITGTKLIIERILSGYCCRDKSREIDIKFMNIIRQIPDKKIKTCSVVKIFPKCEEN